MFADDKASDDNDDDIVDNDAVAAITGFLIGLGWFDHRTLEGDSLHSLGLNTCVGNDSLARRDTHFFGIVCRLGPAGSSP